MVIYITSAEKVFLFSFAFVCLFVCLQDYAKTTQPIVFFYTNFNVLPLLEYSTVWSPEGKQLRCWMYWTSSTSVHKALTWVKNVLVWKYITAIKLTYWLNLVLQGGFWTCWCKVWRFLQTRSIKSNQRSYE